MKKDFIFGGIIAVILATGIVLLCAFQNGGDTGTLTLASALTPRTTAGIFNVTNPINPANPTILQNVGQSAHYLAYCWSAGVNALQIWMEASYDGTTNWVPVSPIGGLSSTVNMARCNIIQAGGYYQNIRVNLNSLGGGSPSVSAWYYASTGPIPFVTGAENSTGIAVIPVADAQQTFLLTDNTTAILLSNPSTNKSYYIRSATLTYGNGVTASGSIVLIQGTGSTCGSGSSNVAQYRVGTGSPVPQSGESLFTLAAGNNLCYVTTGVGGPVALNLSDTLY